jgi:hypothetical protein
MVMVIKNPSVFDIGGFYFLAIKIRNLLLKNGLASKLYPSVICH